MKLWFKKRGLIRSSAEALVLPSSDPPERLQGSGLLEVPTEADVVPIDSEATAVGRRRKGSFGFAERSRDRSRTRSRDGPREQSSEWQPDPLGLSVVYAPNTKRSLDIIFVHGLGGSSRRTWCKNKDLGLFWPGLWLSQEVDISTARILSFGYNANYQSTGPGSILNISDFAKDLLYEMRFGKDEQMQELNIGEVPVIFVVHSMGGLVVKKAFILGHNDSHYLPMIAEIRAILFLSTPHRGTDFADILNRILAVSIFGQSPKQYVADLKRNSPALTDINDQFRHFAPKLQILSFYETLQTTMGPLSILVLDRDSSTLGFPDEISKALVTDHHDVCKYPDPQDINYISVRNAIQSFIKSFGKRRNDSEPAVQQKSAPELDLLLGVCEGPEDDHTFFSERWMSGTCAWMLSEELFLSWLRNRAVSGVLWLHAPPGSGKSIMASYLITHLQSSDLVCQYHFFRFSDQTKRSLGGLLRSLALQISEQVPVFQHALKDLSVKGLRLDKADARTIWQKLFVSILFKLDIGRPLYWILDGLDESDSTQLLPELLSKLSTSSTLVRVLVISRYNSSLSLAFERLSHSIPVKTMSIEKNVDDIQLYVESEMRYLHGSLDFKVHVTRQILKKAMGNFLWVHLASREVLQCHTQGDIEAVLRELPAGMKSLYQRMEINMAQHSKAADIELARRIFTWTVCSHQTLSVQDLSYALQPQLSAFLDLKRTISQVCGQFIVVDGKNHITMVHQTAREFLTTEPNLRCGIDVASGHEEILLRCLHDLLDPGLRGAIESSSAPPFLSYSAVSWFHHLSLAPAGSQASLILLSRFLESESVLTWIYYLAKTAQIKALAHASKAVASFAHRRRRYDSSKSPLLHHLQELELLEQWATDFVKILGKFGADLLKTPFAIYQFVPQFCPRSSATYQQFARHVGKKGLTVSGISNRTWDDSLARLSVGTRQEAEMVKVSDCYLAVSTSQRIIVIWDSISLQEILHLPHQEPITSMCFSNAGDLFVSCGLYNIKVWKVTSGQLLYTVPNPSGSRASTITFARDDSVLLMGSDDRRVLQLPLHATSGGWQVLDSRILSEDSSFPGAYHNSPSCMAFNSNATQIAVGFRGFPLSVWAIDSPRLINRCMRDKGHGRKQSNSWTEVTRVIWHPITGEILGLYLDGSVFRWHPVHNNSQELHSNASGIACSPEGSFFATYDVDGIIQIYNYQHFTLVYQLSWEMPVVDLAFSPDCRRLFDVRGSACHVWEPNILIRFSDTDERGSDVASETGSGTLISMASETSVDTLNSITALAPSPADNYYCAGDDEGHVYIYNSCEDVKTTLWRSSNMMTVELLSWSPSGHRIACAEVGGKIIVKNVIRSTLGLRTTDDTFELKVKIENSQIRQILFNVSSQLLLIAGQVSSQVWSLETDSIIASTLSKNPGSCQRWINHPGSNENLLLCDSESLTVYQWKTLTELSSTTIDAPSASDISLQTHSGAQQDYSTVNQLSPSQSAIAIERFQPASDGSYIILQTSTNGFATQCSSRRAFILPVPAIPDAESIATTGTVPDPLQPLSLPPSVVAQIETVLDIQPGNRLVFLDHDFWLCSFQLNAHPSAVAQFERHFFLPKGWVEADSLALCGLTNDGALLYPRNGEVAVLRCDALATGQV